MADHFTSPSTFIDAVVWIYVCFGWPSSVRRCVRWSQISARRSNTKLQQFHRLYTPQKPSFVYCFKLVFTNKHLYNIVHQKFHCRSFVFMNFWSGKSFGTDRRSRQKSGDILINNHYFWRTKYSSSSQPTIHPLHLPWLPVLFHVE